MDSKYLPIIICCVILGIIYYKVDTLGKKTILYVSMLVGVLPTYYIDV